MIKIGNVLQLEMRDEEGLKKYRSKLLDHEASKLYIDFPVSEETEKPKFFLEGTAFSITTVGADGAVYSFETEVIGREKRNMPMLVLKDPGRENYTRTQRREFVRVDCFLDTAVYSFDGSFKPFTSTTIDLSAGGSAITLPKDISINKHDKVKLWLSLPFRDNQAEYIEVHAEAIRTYEEHGSLKGSFKFVDLIEGTRQTIVRYCYERQRELKNKLQ
ncbi:flagellar brake domain-containing protein [Paenalkalicoccus suaedae]|uniref:Flagellar brake domain-containing protein n=1 Tax=Paenalkalicoccus suaedae TaxID=2592382 RepID=A0A859FCJ9_9BACI|nr:flagellar brake domain-containing protein [Paenalkalicoccus suaedae]QKS71073.1 flagellar brake domain-containing protein [Paenalkalicoccus suaedae]